jgi:hypothetical protein
LTVTPDPPEEAPHCSYTGAAKVEPAPEIVPPLLLAAVVLEELEELVDDELELPHALIASASTAEPTTAPILFLITTSPWLD